ncbi:MAG TPA: hypothetical protein VH436_16355 [Vicinamibacterales bacterium]|jgi:hypothetical protein
MKRTVITAFIVGLIASAVVTDAQKKEWSFPRTKSYGRATTEYNGVLHVVINYDYSQRKHGSKWLLVDIGMSAGKRFVLHKNDLKLLTPNGRELPVAPQQALNDDTAGITSVLQNASIWRRPLEHYFNQRGMIERFRFQVAPPGAGTVTDEVVVDNDWVALGAVFFRTPDGTWDAGTYRLEINTTVDKAALPIKLE